MEEVYYTSHLYLSDAVENTNISSKRLINDKSLKEEIKVKIYFQGLSCPCPHSNTKTLPIIGCKNL